MVPPFIREILELFSPNQQRMLVTFLFAWAWAWLTYGRHLRRIRSQVGAMAADGRLTSDQAAAILDKASRTSAEGAGRK